MSLKRRDIHHEEDNDPMASIVNMTDVMLVLAVGFMIFAIMSTGLETIMFSDMTQEQKQSAVEAAKQMIELEDNYVELNQTPENITSSGSGYQKMGTTYQDPKTGKMVVVQEELISPLLYAM